VATRVTPAKTEREQMTARSKVLAIGFTAVLLALVSSCKVDDSEDERGDAGPGDPCEDTIDCTPGSICWNDICIEEGSLRFSLVWTAETDLDLHVQIPGGEEISYSNPSVGGGELDVDDCVSSNCAIPNGNHVENVFFAETPSAGTYTYWVYNYSCATEADFTLEVAVGASVQATHSGTLEAACVDSEHYTYTH